MKKNLLVFCLIAALMFFASCGNDSVSSEGSRYGSITIGLISRVTTDWIKDAEIEVFNSFNNSMGRMIPFDSLYRKESLAPGLYKVVVSHPYYHGDEIPSIEVRVNDDNRPAIFRLERRPSTLRLIDGSGEDIEELSFASGDSTLAFAVFNDGGTPFIWRIDDVVEWISVRPQSDDLDGGEQSAIMVSIDRSRQGVGVNSARISITSNLGAVNNLTISTQAPQGVSLTLKANPPLGGRVSHSPDSVNVFVRGTSITIRAVANDGYIFVNWSGGEIENANRNSATTTATLNSDAIIYANFIQRNIIVSFDPQGGTSVSSQNVAQNDVIRLPNTEKTGHTFDGWFTEGGAPVGMAGTNYTVTSASDITLFARWTPIIHTVTFNSHGGTPATQQRSAAHNTPISLPTTTRTGFTFNGWWTAQTGGIRANDPYTVDGNITLHARWINCVPTAPQNVRGSAQSPNSIMVFWEPVNGATSYDIERATNANGPFSSAGPSHTNSFTDNGLAMATNYFYRVRARRDGCGVSVFSATSPVTRTLCVGTPPDVAPTVSGFCNTNTQVFWQQFGWNAVPNATHYEISVNGGGWVRHNSNSRTFETTRSSVRPITTTTLRVRAVNICGPGPQSNLATVGSCR
jgi:uncharacterized repeat protein (TIGR02543 family)